jgi:hypothetical protein
MILPGWFPAIAAAAATPPVTAFAFFNSSSSSGVPTITLPTGIQPSDVIVLLDSRVSFGTVPTNVVPAGFTQIATVSGTDSLTAVRNTMTFKIAGGGEGGATITGMSSDLAGEMLAVVFRPNGRVTSITLGDVETQFSNNNPTAHTLGASAGTPPLILVAGYSSSGDIDPRSFSPAKDGEAANGTLGQYIAWKFYGQGSSPADHSVDMDDEGSSNCIISAYLQAA